MMGWVLRKLVGTQNERELRRLRPLVEVTTRLEPTIQALSDADLRARTDQFRERLARGTSLDALLPEAFAVVREAGRRRIGLRHFDVQVMGGIVLHRGRIAEMATGEGKTLVATLAVYLNALTGRGVHVVTVNDYLARRDSEWMGPIYEALGLTVGTIQHDLEIEARRAAYQADVTYGTNNEFGFDYLRDNMVHSLEHMVQRPFQYAIVDEVDSILIDEARTPLIISGPAEESTDRYYRVARLIPELTRGRDYEVEEKTHTVSLTDAGLQRAEELLGIENLYDPRQIEWLHYIEQGLRACSLYHRDEEYVVKDGEVLIVDEFTGRLMPGRRWSDGLHQAVEAKEGVEIRRENQTLATITFQNFFRMYPKLAGMTGTALTEAAEFHHIYKLDTIVVPTNQPLARTNHEDLVYRTAREKFEAVVSEITALHQAGRPVLVGTISIEKSERLSELLRHRQIAHQVLNAKYHEREAAIIAQAGRLGAVTIATNMAGRGTDILLGGNPLAQAREERRRREAQGETVTEAGFQQMIATAQARAAEEHTQVVALGGLHMIGTERHEARRIDNQLRGRAGRQGDPGSSRFYLSLEDDLMRIFGSDRIAGLMGRLGLEEGQEIQHRWVTKSIEVAQRQVEGRNFEIRKHLLQYDDVMNRQREVIYEERRRVLRGEVGNEQITGMVEQVSERALDTYWPEGGGERDPAGLAHWLRSRLLVAVDEGAWAQSSRADARNALAAALLRAYEQKHAGPQAEVRRHLERMILLQVIDAKWKDHLAAIDFLREGIHLRAYGQQDPLVEYQREAFEMFEGLMVRVQEETLEFFFKLHIPEAPQPMTLPSRVAPRQFLHPEVSGLLGAGGGGQGAGDMGQGAGGTGQGARSAAGARPGEAATPVRRPGPKVGRNDPCPCGSGRKYKKCCGV